MTNPPNSATTAPDQPDDNSLSRRASWCKSNAPVGSNALASPAPGVAGADQHRGALVHGDTAEDRLQEENHHTCHVPTCTHTLPPKPHVQQRVRLRNENKRMRQPSCRMNDDEYQLLTHAASACNMSVANFLAHAALRAARDLDRTASEIAGEREMLAELFAVRRHLAQIGNNINQVAKALNSGAEVPYAQSVLDAVQRSARRVDAFTQRHLDAGTRA